MAATLADQLNELLDAIFIFDDEFKFEIKQKLPSLDADKPDKLLAVLREVYAHQQELIAKKLEEDPEWRAKILARKQTLKKEIWEERVDEIKAKDQNTIQKLLTKIKNL